MEAVVEVRVGNNKDILPIRAHKAHALWGRGIELAEALHDMGEIEEGRAFLCHLVEHVVLEQLQHVPVSALWLVKLEKERERERRGRKKGGRREYEGTGIERKSGSEGEVICKASFMRAHARECPLPLRVCSSVRTSLKRGSFVGRPVTCSTIAHVSTEAETKKRKSGIWRTDRGRERERDTHTHTHTPSSAWS